MLVENSADANCFGAWHSLALAARRGAWPGEAPPPGLRAASGACQTARRIELDLAGRRRRERPREARPQGRLEAPLLRGIFQRKPLQAILAAAEAPETALKRTLGPVQLPLLGIGAIIGAGIFSTVGTAAAGGGDHLGAGPALVLSFVITAITCGFAALCSAEFASMVP